MTWLRLYGFRAGAKANTMTNAYAGGQVAALRHEVIF